MRVCGGDPGWMGLRPCVVPGVVVGGGGVGVWVWVWVVVLCVVWFL